MSKTGNQGSNLVLRHYKLDLMARFIEIESVNPKLEQERIENELGCSSSTLKRYRQDVFMLSPHKIPPNSSKRRQKFPNTSFVDETPCDHDLKTPQDLEIPQQTSKELKQPLQQLLSVQVKLAPLMNLLKKKKLKRKWKYGDWRIILKKIHNQVFRTKKWN